MPFKSLLFREKTNAPVKDTIVFNASGVYYPPYGKTSFLLQGQGVAGTAAYTEYAGTNPPVYAGTNPPVYAGTNPATGGNIKTANASMYVKYTSAVFGPWSFTPPIYYAPAGTSAYAYSVATYAYPIPANSVRYNNTPAGPTFTNYAFLAAVSYNPIVPGTAYYNAGTAYYNAGTAYYTPVPATTGATTNVLGVTLAGGVGGAAPIVGYVPISTIGYTAVGIPISVPSGGYIKIQNI